MSLRTSPTDRIECRPPRANRGYHLFFGTHLLNAGLRSEKLNATENNSRGKKVGEQFAEHVGLYALEEGNRILVSWLNQSTIPPALVNNGW